MKLVRLSSIAAVEIVGAKSFSQSDKDLYIYPFGVNRQVVNEDLSNNSRDRSLGTYVQNVHLKPTPTFYLGSTFHADNKFSLTHSLSYLQCRLHIANGFNYSGSIYGVYIRIYAQIGNREITLASLIDTYNNSSITANGRELALEGVIFNQSIKFDILDLDSILNNPAMSDVKTALLGVYESDAPSELLVEFAIIENDDVNTFNQGVDTYSQVLVQGLHKASLTTIDEQAEIVCEFTLDEENKWLQMKVDHSRYNLEQYLLQYLNEDEAFEVLYDLSFEHYDSANDIIGSEAFQLKNTNSEFALLRYRPIIDDESIDHTLAECRASIRNLSTGLIITRYNSLVITSPTSVFSTDVFPLSSVTIKAINNINVTQRNIVSPNEMPKMVTINKPIYVTTAENDIIVLHPTSTPVRILLSEVDTKFSKLLKLKIGTRTYPFTAKTADNVTFVIPENEYYTNDSAYYILDENDQMVSYGRIARFSVS